jgi:leucyl aminopeptidase
MKTGFNKESWTTLMPETYSWLKTVPLDTTTDVVSGALHIVLLSDSEKVGQDTIALNAKGLQSGLQEKIVAAAAGWRGAGNFIVNVEGSQYLLVAPTKLRVTAEQKARQAGLDAAKALKALKLKTLVLVKAEGFCMAEEFLGIAGGLYQTTTFKVPKKDQPTQTLPSRVTFLGNMNADEFNYCRSFARSEALVRFLQDAPANWLDAPRFGDIAADLAKEFNFKCTLHDKQSLEKLGMGSYLSVNAGSTVPPRMIVIEIDGKDNNKSVALIGKGLTFDAGGISLKPGAGMEEMKYDMSGGAAVLGSAVFLSQVKPPVKTICVIGCTDNMPSATATKPGDIVVSMNGKTIEVINTDAEGRLVLADLLHYTNVTYKPDLMIDIATLTGAVLIALGTVGAGIMSNDDATARYVIKCGESKGEPFWQLPLWPELEQEVKGTVADLNNIAKPSVKAGTIIGGMFLKEFVGETKWAHLDIAGTGWNCRTTGFPSSGGCGYGLRTMTESVLKFNQ